MGRAREGLIYRDVCEGTGQNVGVIGSRASAANAGPAGWPASPRSREEALMARDLGEGSRRLFGLRPVRFRYKP